MSLVRAICLPFLSIFMIWFPRAIGLHFEGALIGMDLASMIFALSGALHMWEYNFELTLILLSIACWNLGVVVTRFRR